MPPKKTTEQFVKEAQAIHGDKYDYSLAEYQGKDIHVEIICNICDEIFWQAPSPHINQKTGCPYCAVESRSDKRRKPLDQFIKEARIIHGNKYDYSLVQYKNKEIKVEIICNVCNKNFYTTPGSHINTHSGCPICADKYTANLRRKPLDQFIKEAEKIHGNKYNYELVEYKSTHTKVLIKCNNCQGTFEQEPNSHISGKNCCPCYYESKGYSQAAINWLESLKDQYDDIQHAENGSEYKLEGTNLKLDGFSPSWSIAFEYHGAMWHGCIECFPDQNAINPVSKKTYRELFEATKAKKKIIEAAGFRYVAVWDCGHKPNLD
jgi:formylmethanofuran dehydrogenase subunit E